MNPSFVRPLPILPPLSTCTLCSLHGVAQSVGISLHHLPFSLPPSPITPILLVIGQNPGIHEDRASTPFLGKSGHILQFAYIRAHGLHDLCTIYVTNTCRCYHRDGEGPTNAHYRACRPHLLPELHHLDGRAPSLTLLTLGAPATTHTYALLGRPRVTLTSSFSHQGATLPCPAPSSNPSSPATAAASSSPRTPASPTSPTDPPPTPPTTPGTSAPAAPNPSPTTSPSSATKKRTKTKTPTTTSASTPPIPSPTTTTETSKTTKKTTKTTTTPVISTCSTVLESDSSTTPTPSTVTSITIFSSFHPAAVDRSNNLIHAVSGHLTLLRAHLTGRMPVPSTPLILSPKGPP